MHDTAAKLWNFNRRLADDAVSWELLSVSLVDTLTVVDERHLTLTEFLKMPRLTSFLCRWLTMFPGGCLAGYNQTVF